LIPETGPAGPALGAFLVGGPRDNAPVDGQKKVIVFLHPFYREKYGCTPVGTYSAAIDPKGDRLYATWNVNRGGRAWDCTALTVIHIPEMERQP
jgi:hypothetical protein